MLNTRFQLITFDLDGTLVDSAPDIAFAVDNMLAELDLPPRGVEQVRHFLGNGVDWLTKRALTGELWTEPAADLLDQARERLLFHYGQINDERTEIYPGVFEALEFAQQAGLALACLTNKKRQFTEPLLQNLELERFFGILVCGDDLPQCKPDPAPLNFIMQQSQVAETETLMIGDSITDVKTARAAGTAVAAVSYGYNHGENIAEAEPDWVIDSMLEICTILQQSS